MNEKNHETRFREFHAANLHVYDRLVEMAVQFKRRRYPRIGIGMLWEVLRYERMLATEDPNSDFKLNDHYRSRYARLIMAQEPDLDGFFELRELKTTQESDAILPEHTAPRAPSKPLPSVNRRPARPTTEEVRACLQEISALVDVAKRSGIAPSEALRKLWRWLAASAEIA